MTEVRNPIQDSDDTIKILITTDNHIGFKENDPIVGNDSWKTFEEIMQIAKDKNVDMVLQSGDLFHINKPSKKSMYQTLRILRKYCLGDRPCELELMSNPSEVFNDGFNTVNYEDPNINVSIPVFAISGNHDDSTGDALLSPMDVLNSTGLINHFGKVYKNDDITVTPILLKKGSTKLAVYGLASVLDERLFRTFRDGNVKFKTPALRNKDWFNLMMVHQNHTPHSKTSYLPEDFLPSFLDFVVWGHEHECIPYSVRNYKAGFDVLQPGSSIATSLSTQETIEKNVFILSLKNREYNIEPIKLDTVRPFIMDDISLKDSGIMPGISTKNLITKYLTNKVNQMISDIKKAWAKQNDLDKEDDIDQNSKIPLPLVRLRVDYSGGYELDNPRRFSNMFTGKVANINDIISVYKKRELPQKKSTEKAPELQEEENFSVKVQAYVSSYLKSSNLSLLPEVGMNQAIKNFVDKDDKSALDVFVNKEIENDIKYLNSADIQQEDGDLLLRYIKGRNKNTKLIVETDVPSTINENISSGTSLVDDEKINKNNMASKRKRRTVKSKEIIESDDQNEDNNEQDKRFLKGFDLLDENHESIQISSVRQQKESKELSKTNQEANTERKVLSCTPSTMVRTSNSKKNKATLPGSNKDIESSIDSQPSILSRNIADASNVTSTSSRNRVKKPAKSSKKSKTQSNDILSLLSQFER